MELLTKLGIDWRLLIAQIVNFTVLLFVLYRFRYKPLSTLLENRRQRIEKSLAEAARIEADAKRMDELKIQRTEEARREAAKIMEEAAQKAEAQRQATLDKTKQAAAVVVMKAKDEIQAEKTAMLCSVQSETANLVVSVAEKVLREKLDDEKDRKFIEETIKQLAGSSS